jgi:hypothetical protein
MRRDTAIPQALLAAFLARVRAYSNQFTLVNADLTFSAARAKAFHG